MKKFSIRKIITVLLCLIVFLTSLNFNTMEVKASGYYRYLRTIEGNAYTASSHKDSAGGSARYWSSTKGFSQSIYDDYLADKSTAAYGGARKEWVPLLTNVYLNAGTYVKFHIGADSCQHVGAKAEIWTSGPKTSAITFNHSNQTTKIHSFSISGKAGHREEDYYYPISESGYYTFDGYGQSAACGTGTHMSIHILASYDIYEWVDTSYTYTITFNANGGSGSVPSTITKSGADSSVVMGDITSTVPTRSGYEFKGWSASSSWSSKRIAYSSNCGGSAASDGTSATTTSGSWTYVDYCSYAGGSTSSRTLTLYAQWERKPFTIYFNDNGGSGGPGSKTINGTGNISSTVPTRTGYKFMGWGASSSWCTKRFIYSGAPKASDGTTATTTSSSWCASNYASALGLSSIEDSVTVYAQWEISKYTVTYNGNGATDGSTASQTFNHGSSVNISANGFTRTGYEFAGWNTKADGSGTSYSAGNTYSTNANLTLYAQWKVSTANYKVLHQQEQLDGTYTTVETESLTGTIGTSVTPAVKNYTGFTSPDTQTVMIAADGSTVVNYYYTRNSYPVTYIDVVDSTSGTILGQSTVSKKYGSTVKGSDLGSSTADNAYYNGYYYVSDTSDTVGTSGATVYRIFKLRTLDISGTVLWTDNSNKWGTRPNSIEVYLYRDGEKIDTTTGLVNSESNEYSFKNLPKYSSSDGHVYNYTVSQSEAVSKTSPEDKYTTTQNTYDFINVLSNTDTDTDSKGLTVSGSIYWEDNGNSLGYRPSTVTITLYQNGEEYKTIEVDTFNNNTYEFIKLPKYDNDLNKYEYTVEETVIANYLVKENGNYVLKDAYTVKTDTPNPLDFTNVFNIPSEPPIPVKPEYTNTVVIKTNTEDKIAISLKGMETIINDDLSVSYGTSYNGQVYNVSANNVGEVLSSIGSGKYEISYYNTAYILNDITCTGDSNIWIEGNGDTYYLVIKDTNSNISGTITLNFSKKDHVGYQSDVSVSNYFKVTIENTSITNLETQVFALSRVIVTAEDIYSVIYENSDTVDDNIYNEGDEVEVLNYEGKVPEGTEFIGWSLTEDAEEADYLVGDIIIIKDKNFSLYPVFKEVEESTETETREVEETDTSETTEKSSEEETSQEETPLEESSTEGTSSMEESIVEEESSESLETQENAEANE